MSEENAGTRVLRTSPSDETITEVQKCHNLQLDEENTKMDQKRISHNEVERNRKKKMRESLLKLATLLPTDTDSDDNSRQTTADLLESATTYLVRLQKQYDDLLQQKGDPQTLKEREEMRLQQASLRLDIERMSKTIRDHGKTQQTSIDVWDGRRKNGASPVSAPVPATSSARGRRRSTAPTSRRQNTVAVQLEKARLRIRPQQQLQQQQQQQQQQQEQQPQQVVSQSQCEVSGVDERMEGPSIIEQAWKVAETISEASSSTSSTAQSSTTTVASEEVPLTPADTDTVHAVAVGDVGIVPNQSAQRDNLPPSLVLPSPVNQVQTLCLNGPQPNTSTLTVPSPTTQTILVNGGVPSLVPAGSSTPLVLSTQDRTETLPPAPAPQPYPVAFLLSNGDVLPVASLEGSRSVPTLQVVTPSANPSVKTPQIVTPSAGQNVYILPQQVRQCLQSQLPKKVSTVLSTPITTVSGVPRTVTQTTSTSVVSSIVKSVETLTSSSSIINSLRNSAMNIVCSVVVSGLRNKVMTSTTSSDVACSFRNQATDSACSSFVGSLRNRAADSSTPESASSLRSKVMISASSNIANSLKNKVMDSTPSDVTSSLEAAGSTCSSIVNSLSNEVVVSTCSAVVSSLSNKVTDCTTSAAICSFKNKAMNSSTLDVTSSLGNKAPDSACSASVNSLRNNVVDSACSAVVSSLNNKETDCTTSAVLCSLKNKVGDSTTYVVGSNLWNNVVDSDTFAVVSSLKNNVAESVSSAGANSRTNTVADTTTYVVTSNLRNKVLESSCSAVASSCRNSVADSASYAVVGSGKNDAVDPASDTVTSILRNTAMDSTSSAVITSLWNKTMNAATSAGTLSMTTTTLTPVKQTLRPAPGLTETDRHTVNVLMNIPDLQSTPAVTGAVSMPTLPGFRPILPKPVSTFQNVTPSTSLLSQRSQCPRRFTKATACQQRGAKKPAKRSRRQGSAKQSRPEAETDSSDQTRSSPVTESQEDSGDTQHMSAPKDPIGQDNVQTELLPQHQTEDQTSTVDREAFRKLLGRFYKKGVLVKEQLDCMLKDLDSGLSLSSPSSPLSSQSSEMPSSLPSAPVVTVTTAPPSQPLDENQALGPPTLAAPKTDETELFLPLASQVVSMLPDQSPSFGQSVVAETTYTAPAPVSSTSSQTPVKPLTSPAPSTWHNLPHSAAQSLPQVSATSTISTPPRPRTPPVIGFSPFKAISLELDSFSPEKSQKSAPVSSCWSVTNVEPKVASPVASSRFGEKPVPNKPSDDKFRRPVPGIYSADNFVHSSQQNSRADSRLCQQQPSSHLSAGTRRAPGTHDSSGFNFTSIGLNLTSSDTASKSSSCAPPTFSLSLSMPTQPSISWSSIPYCKPSAPFPFLPSQTSHRVPMPGPSDPTLNMLMHDTGLNRDSSNIPKSSEGSASSSYPSISFSTMLGDNSAVSMDKSSFDAELSKMGSLTHKPSMAGDFSYCLPEPGPSRNGGSQTLLSEVPPPQRLPQLPTQFSHTPVVSHQNIIQVSCPSSTYFPSSSFSSSSLTTSPLHHPSVPIPDMDHLINRGFDPILNASPVSDSLNGPRFDPHGIGYPKDLHHTRPLEHMSGLSSSSRKTGSQQSSGENKGHLMDSSLGDFSSLIPPSQSHPLITPHNNPTPSSTLNHIPTTPPSDRAKKRKYPASSSTKKKIPFTPDFDTNFTQNIFDSSQSFPLFNLQKPMTQADKTSQSDSQFLGNSLFTNAPRPLSSADKKSSDLGAAYPMFPPPPPPPPPPSHPQNGIGINFQPGFSMGSNNPSGPVTSVSVTPHVNNFSLGSIFSEVSNSSGESSIKFTNHTNPILPPPQAPMDPSGIQHQHQGTSLYHNRSHHRNPHLLPNAMTLNPFLGHNRSFETNPTWR